MPGITYMLQFTHRDPGDIPETIEYIALADAWKASAVPAGCRRRGCPPVRGTG